MVPLVETAWRKRMITYIALVMDKIQMSISIRDTKKPEGVQKYEYLPSPQR